MRGKRVLLVGLGVHGGGVGTTKWLVQQGAEVRVTDLQSETALAASVQQVRHRRVTFHLGGYQAADFRWADLIVLNPGVPPNGKEITDLLPKKQNVVLANELTLFLERCPSKTIGITGTRGKTSTTLLITHLLKAAKRSAIASGNVRQQPMLEILPKLHPKDIAVLELSSFQLELVPTIQRSVETAIITNLHVDHLSRHGTMEEYERVKSYLFRYQDQESTAILNYDHPATRRMAKLVTGRVIWYTTSSKPVGPFCVFVKDGWVMERAFSDTRKIVPLAAWKIPGDHQRSNLLAAIVTVRVHEVKPQEILRGIKTWKGVPHRQEIVRTWKGNRFINDTTATSPDGTLAALNVFPNALYILGGTDKQLSFDALATAIVRRRVPVVFLPGTATDRLIQKLRRRGWKETALISTSMREAIQAARARAKKGQDIILSPGAASFGLFRHEFDRGEQFVSIVKGLRS